MRESGYEFHYALYEREILPSAPGSVKSNPIWKYSMISYLNRNWQSDERTANLIIGFYKISLNGKTVFFLRVIGFFMNEVLLIILLNGLFWLVVD
jgi:hypothetical protein